MEIDQILKCVDHTLLKQTAVFADVKKLLDEAERFHTASACISPTMLARAKAYKGNAVRLCTVIGFPIGCQSSQVKSFEIERAIEDGADELDAVIDLGALKEGNDRKILSDLREWKGICKDRILKVIVEACLLTEEEKIRMCEIVTESGADYIKTSTGFSSGGATREDVALFAAHVGKNVRIKAAGGIATLEDAEAFLALGASRLGTSKIISLLRRN